MAEKEGISAKPEPPREEGGTGRSLPFKIGDTSVVYDCLLYFL
jgi:hypothetical protein